MIKIYYLENSTGVFYIGKTKNSLSNRLSSHKFQLKLKGINDISIHLLDEVEEKNWKPWESYWIEQFQTWGFNLINQNKGGGGPITHTQETINKMRENHNYDEGGKKISLAKLGSKYNIIKKGKLHKTYGTTQSKETIEKKRKSLTGQIKNPYKTRKDKGVNRPNIAGENHYLFGKSISDSHKYNKSLAALGNKNRSKIILQLDLQNNVIQKFESAAEAERQLNIKGIRNVCCGKSKTAGGFKWKYE
jgi:hypothetical protein